ncbi:hypothetical protein [Costertonia aggregata]|uniref:Polymer-forming cytoskeletal protein n=1 Tax=Costertonia aggregata TaxID=343403 RepID=A0A7H9ATQ7_9FLAO|nr:hypothetical protein [Costertonia aggregata]QLG46787.1 hypothetical protein HYG79_15990 [Costertonia aggregata]
MDTIKHADLGVQIALQKETTVNDTVPIALGFTDQIKVKSIKSYWGIFEKYTVTSTFNKNRISKTAMVGSSSPIDRPALYLQDLKRPMIIVGQSRIIGDAYLPQQGIRPGNIAGQSYYNKHLVYGREKGSSERLPKLDKNLLNHLSLLVSQPQRNYSGQNISVVSGDVVQNSFLNPAVTISGDFIDLSGVTLIGNIIVQASQRIAVDNSSQLTDVLLLAPKIYIGDRTLGQFQAIAQSEINVGKSCILEYPSAIVVNNKRKWDSDTSQVRETNINISENTIIRGAVMYLGKSEEQLFYPQIHVGKQAYIQGEVFCEQNLELKGGVKGSVTTRSFMAMENGSIYQNHLFNGTIDSDALPLEYSGIIFDELNNPKSIVQWLY